MTDTSPTTPGAELRRMRSLIGDLDAVVWEADARSMAHTFVSEGATDILGYSPAEWLDDPTFWADHVHPDDRRRAVAEFVRATTDGDRFDMEYRFLTANGGEVWLRDLGRVVKDVAGSPTLVRGLMVEITANKQAELLAVDLATERATARRLREVDEMKNTFLQAVSHDLRTPLAAILGLALTLSREDLDIDQADARAIADRIAQNARKLDGIVNDLLDLDRLSRGIVEPVLRMTDLGALVRTIAEASEIERSLTITTKHITLPIDAAKVERIVENLLANAGRHTPTDAHVWVRVAASEGGAEVRIEDDGPGVPGSMRDTVFEPFAQIDASASSPGVGVGLALVARFAELHGGRAWVQDRRGGGASFRVFLPAEPIVPVQEEPADADQGAATGSSDPDASQA